MRSEEKVELFIERLEQRLKEKGMTVPEFAKAMGVSRSMVYKWTTHESVMSLDKYFKALQILEIDESEFIESK